MTQFRLSGSQVPHIADLLAAGAGKAQGSVHDMGMALNQSGLVASQFGLSIEDTTGVLAEFANAGLIGSDAGTSFKTMLLAMANPSKQTQSLMDSLNISFYDAQGQFIGLSGVADVLRTKLGGLTEAQRNQALGQIFGNDAIRAAAILYKDGSAGVDKWKGAVNDAGYASETAAKLTDNLAGDLERLRGSLETLAIQSGSGANSGLRVLAQGLNGLVGQFLSMPPAVGSTITVLAGVGGALALGLAGFIKLRKGVAEAVTQLEAMGPAGEKAAAGLQRTAAAAGKAVLAIVAMEAASAAINALTREAVNVDRLTASLTNLANTGKLSGEIVDAFGKNLVGIQTDAMVAGSGIAQWVDKVESAIPFVGDLAKSLTGLGMKIAGGESYDQAKANLAGLDQALTNFMNTTHDAGKAGDLWNQVLLKSGLNTDQLAKLLPGAWSQLQKLQAEAHGAAGATGQLGGAAGSAKGQLAAEAAAADKAAAELDALEKATEQAFGAQMSLDRAAIAAKDGMSKLRDEITHGTRTLDINTAEGRKNRSAVLDQIAAIENLRETRVKHGESLDSANKKYTRDIDGLRRSMLQAGYTKGAVDKLIGSYKRIPPKVTTDIRQTGAGPVSDRLWALGEIQRRLKAGNLSANMNSYLHNVAQGRLAEGGGVPGTSPHKKADNILIAATAGEHMWTVDEVQAAGGHQNVKKLRQMALSGALDPAAIAAYAGGGQIWPYVVNASKTRVPSVREAEAAVIPAVPAGGQTWRWIIQAARALVGAVRVISTVRPGAHTLSGNLSYHAMGRAVDFAPSMQLARKWNVTYGRRTKEEITPWRQYDIWNGRAHHYSAALHAQHSGGNAHVHIAMAGGGRIGEPVVGVGASGKTYSFGEAGPEIVTPQASMSGGTTTIINVTLQNNAPIGSQMELDNWLVGSIDRLRYRVRV
jgi:TP901 family phage tail tape measure protein